MRTFDESKGHSACSQCVHTTVPENVCAQLAPTAAR